MSNRKIPITNNPNKKLIPITTDEDGYVKLDGIEDVSGEVTKVLVIDGFIYLEVDEDYFEREDFDSVTVVEDLVDIFNKTNSNKRKF